MLSVTKLSAFTRFLVSICLCFHKCLSVIEEDKFTFMKSIPMNEDGSVYLTFPVPDKRNLILTCSATCVTEVDCIGIDICDGRLCRLWNLTFSPSIPLNNSNVFCQRYIKVRAIYALYETFITFMFNLYIVFVKLFFFSNGLYFRYLSCMVYFTFTTSNLFHTN